MIRSLAPDPLKQEPLLVENVPDPLAGEQVSGMISNHSSVNHLLHLGTLEF